MRHVGVDSTVILTHLNKYLLIHPVIGPPVNMPVVMLGATTVEHDGSKCHFALPGAFFFDGFMKETLISVTKLLETNFKIFFRLPHHCITVFTDGFEPIKYPFYGGFLLLPPVASTHDRQMTILHYSDNT